MSNRFRNPVMRGYYDAAMRAFEVKHRDLFRADGTPHTSNGVADFFWAGYNGLTEGRFKFHQDRQARTIIGYAYYRAGQDAKRNQPQGESK